MVDDRGTCNVWKDFPIAEKGRVKTAPSPHPDFRRAIGDVKKNRRIPNTKENNPTKKGGIGK